MLCGNESGHVLVLLGELPVLLMRIYARDAALDTLLDLLESVGGDVDVLGGVGKDVSPGKGGEISMNFAFRRIFPIVPPYYSPCLDEPLLQGLLML